MKRTLFFTTLTVLSAITVPAQNKEFTCVVEGKVMNGDSKHVRILENGKNIYKHGHDIALEPDGTFRLEIKDSVNREYEIFLGAELSQGQMTMYRFISEPGTVRAILYQTVFKPDFTTYDSLRKLSSVKGGPLNARHARYAAHLLSAGCTEAHLLEGEMSRLYKENKAYSERTQAIFDAMKVSADSSDAYKNKLNEEFMALTKKPQEFYSTAFLEIKTKYETAAKTCYRDRCEYISANPDAASLCILYDYALNKNPNMDTAAFVGAARILTEKHPHHPYSASIALAVKSLDNARAGKPFTDFTAPDLEGTLHTLSEEIKGRIAVLDLWASWCGSCIEKGLKLKPVYEKYKDKGFVVVGVAREFKNTEALKGALKRNGYPWLNLLELDDRTRLWALYGVPKSGGAVFLIDRNGKIVAVNPTAEEVESYLGQNL